MNLTKNSCSFFPGEQPNNDPLQVQKGSARFKKVQAGSTSCRFEPNRPITPNTTKRFDPPKRFGSGSGFGIPLVRYAFGSYNFSICLWENPKLLIPMISGLWDVSLSPRTHIFRNPQDTLNNSRRYQSNFKNSIVQIPKFWK